MFFELLASTVCVCVKYIMVKVTERSRLQLSKMQMLYSGYLLASVTWTNLNQLGESSTTIRTMNIFNHLRETQSTLKKTIDIDRQSFILVNWALNIKRGWWLSGGVWWGGTQFKIREMREEKHLWKQKDSSVFHKAQSQQQIHYVWASSVSSRAEQHTANSRAEFLLGDWICGKHLAEEVITCASDDASAP